MLRSVEIRTSARSQMVDITDKESRVIREEGLAEGIVLVYCPHTTAGVTINEGADPDVVKDMLMLLDELCPWTHPSFRHGEGNSAAHLKSSLIGTSVIIPVHNGRMMLGTWQKIYFCEFDGPRNRKFLVQLIKSPENTSGA